MTIGQPQAASQPSLVLMEVPSPAGTVHLVITPEDERLRLAGFADPDANLHRLGSALLARGLTRSSGPATIRDALERYADGDLSAVDALAVEQPGGEFYQAAWRAMRGVSPAHPASYTDLAARSGRPAAVRAAASACARNLVALVVPCHRIVRSDGTLGGYYYGIDVKRVLLAHEERFGV